MYDHRNVANTLKNTKIFLYMNLFSGRVQDNCKLFSRNIQIFFVRDNFILSGEIICYEKVCYYQKFRIDSCLIYKPSITEI